jgi:hypothetical protein
MPLWNFRVMFPSLFNSQQLKILENASSSFRNKVDASPYTADEKDAREKMKKNLHEWALDTKTVLLPLFSRKSPDPVSNCTMHLVLPETAQYELYSSVFGL